jgi:hypothetical protein
MPMPHYFFDVTENQVHVQDEIGLEFADDQEARNAAMLALPELAAHQRSDGDRHVVRLTVRNKAGLRICQATLTMEAEWLPS